MWCHSTSLDYQGCEKYYPCPRSIGKTKSYLSLIDGNPVCCGEPLVVFYVVHSVLQIAEPLCQVNLEQVPQEVLQIRAKVRGESYLCGKKTKKEMKKQNKVWIIKDKVQKTSCALPLFILSCIIREHGMNKTKTLQKCQ